MNSHLKKRLWLTYTEFEGCLPAGGTLLVYLQEPPGGGGAPGSVCILWYIKAMKGHISSSGPLRCTFSTMLSVVMNTVFSLEDVTASNQLPKFLNSLHTENHLVKCQSSRPRRGHDSRQGKVWSLHTIVLLLWLLEMVWDWQLDGVQSLSCFCFEVLVRRLCLHVAVSDGFCQPTTSPSFPAWISKSKWGTRLFHWFSSIRGQPP